MNGKRRDFPKEICIGENIFYRIRFKRNLLKEGLAGLCHMDTKEIWIACGLSCQERLATFWHEVSHALDYEYGIKLSHKQVYALEKPLAELFSRNAWVTWAKWVE